jgi:hypothetical protein
MVFGAVSMDTIYDSVGVCVPSTEKVGTDSYQIACHRTLVVNIPLLVFTV